MTAAIRVSELQELTSLTSDDLFLVSDIELDASNKVTFSSLQSNLLMAGLGDVGDTSGITTGQVLQWNGTEFIPVTLPTQVVDGSGNITIDLTPITDALAAIHSKLGVGSMETHLGGLPGNILPDNATVKAIFTAIEAEIDTLKLEILADDAEIESVEQDVDALNSNFNSLQNNFTTLVATVDSDDLALKGRLDTLEAAGYITAVPAEYVTETELAAEGFLTISDLSGFATENYVDSQIAAIPAPNPPNLTPYALTTYVDSEIAALTLAGIAGVSGTPGVGQILKWDGSNWAFAPDVDTDTQVDLTGYATEAYVTTQISNISTDLVDLADVFIPSVNDGEVLTYNAATGGWVPQPVTPGASAIGDLTDVTINGTPTTGHVLKWDGLKWTSAAETGGGGGGIALSDISVIQYNPSSSGSLLYNQVTGVFSYTPPEAIGLGDLSVTNNASPGGSGSLSYNNTTGTFTFNQPGGPNASDFTWDSSLVPQGNNIYDLGSSSNQVKDVFVSGAAKFGANTELSLYYDATVGVNVSFLDSDAFIIRTTNGEEYATFLKDGPVELYYDGLKKFGTSSDGATVLGDLTVDGKVYFGNVFSNLGDLPNASTYHGMFAHVHGTGAAYYAHGGNWVELANKSDIGASSYALTDLTDVDTTAPQNDDVLVYSSADSEFKFENLTSVVSSLSLQNIVDGAQGVEVTGRVAASGLDLSTGGQITAAGCSIDFGSSLVSFSGAQVSGLSGEIRDAVDLHLNQTDGTNTLPSNGQILSWNSTGGPLSTGDYEWVTPATGGGGGGSSTLDGLTDVALGGTPDDGDVLKWNSASSKWTASPDIDTDTNVDLTTVNSTLTQLTEFQENLIAGTAVSQLDFSANTTTGSSPLNVSLTPTYEGNANRFDVDWGDGTQEVDLTSGQLSHTYNNASGGQFDVTMTAKNSNGVGFGSTSVEGKTSYITLYTPAPTMDIAWYSAATGGGELTGNSRWGLMGSPVYLENETQNSSGVNARFTIDWGDSTFDLVQADNASGGVDGVRAPHTYTSTGYYAVELELTDHDTADPSLLPVSTTDNIKIYDANVAAPTGLSGKLNDIGGTKARLCSGFTDNTGGVYNKGDQVVRLTSGSAQTSMSNFAYDAENGTLRALRNNVTVGQIFMNQPHNQYLTDGELALNGEADYTGYNSSGSSTNFQNSIYYPGLYKGFKARTVTNYSVADAGLNEVKITHSTTGDSNARYFCKDTTDLPSVDASAAVLTVGNQGALRYISGRPHYADNNTFFNITGLVFNNLTSEMYPTSANDILRIDNTSAVDGANTNIVGTNYFDYGDIEGGVALLDGTHPYANMTNYSVGPLVAASTLSNSVSSRRLRVQPKNAQGYGNYEHIQSHIINVFSRAQTYYNISEISISTDTSLGNGAFTDNGVRVFDFAGSTDDTPAINGAINYFSNNPYTEASDPGVSGTQEASLIYGDIKNDTTDWSSGYLPAGPDRSGDLGTQFFTFAFRRQVVASFDIQLQASGVKGVWIAAPGTAIDSASGLNGWLDCSTAYAGSGVPGSDTGNGGNGGDGCAFNNGSVIPIDTSINSRYTMTLGEENMSNATGNVVLVRIALASGQNIQNLSIKEAS